MDRSYPDDYHSKFKEKVLRQRRYARERYWRKYILKRHLDFCKAIIKKMEESCCQSSTIDQ